MATLFDISVLNSVTVVVVFLLVFIGSWGALMWVNPFKDKGKSFYGLLAFLISVLVVLSRKVVSIILFSTPWLVVLCLVAFFFIFFSKMFGVGDESLMNAMKGPVKGWLIFFTALIMVFALGTTLGPGLLSATTPNQGTSTDGSVGPVVNATGTTASGDFGSNLVLTLFHPKIIAVLFLFLLGTLTILLLND